MKGQCIRFTIRSSPVVLLSTLRPGQPRNLYFDSEDPSKPPDRLRVPASRIFTGHRRHFPRG